MKTKGALRLLMVAALMAMAATMLAGCESEIQETYDYLESQSSREDDFGGDSSGTTGDVDCFRDCKLNAIWGHPGPPGESIQITSQCSLACCARLSGKTQDRQAACANLDGWTNHLTYDAKDACRSC